MCQRADRKVCLDGHAARGRWLSREAQSLAADIAKLGVPGGGVGSEKADRLIWSWLNLLLGKPRRGSSHGIIQVA